MAFYLGSAMGGLFSGAQDASNLYNTYQNQQLKQFEINAGNAAQAAAASVNSGGPPPTDAQGNAITQNTTANGPNATGSPQAPIDVNKVSQLPKNMQALPGGYPVDRRGDGSTPGGYPVDKKTEDPYTPSTGTAAYQGWFPADRPQSSSAGTGPGPYDQPATVAPPAPMASALPVEQTGPGPDLSHVNNLPTGQTLGNWIHGRGTNYLPPDKNAAIPAPAPMQARSPVGGSARPMQPTIAQPNSGLGAQILSAGGALSAP